MASCRERASHLSKQLRKQVQLISSAELAHRTVIAFRNRFRAFGHLQQWRRQRSRQQHPGGDRGKDREQQRERQGGGVDLLQTAACQRQLLILAITGLQCLRVRSDRGGYTLHHL